MQKPTTLNMKKKKVKYIDDGHTIYNMDGVGRPKVDTKNNVGLTKKERRAAIKAALELYLPRILVAITCFGVAAVLLYLWLS